jgi:GAF domain-containing protein
MVGQQTSAWQELLGEIIEHNPAERERLANAIGVRSITLTRWARRESDPRQPNLRLLLRALPADQRELFSHVLEQEYPGILHEASQEAIAPAFSPFDLPYGFVNEVLSARAHTPGNLRYWTISHQILQHALRRFDSGHGGIAVTIPRCMPRRSDGKVRSLREHMGLGTPPWESDLKPKIMFLGAESLAGYVVMKGHAVAIPDTAVNSVIPAIQVDYEVSAAAAPIRYEGKVAGCLLFSSTQSDFFSEPELLELIQGYANLVALAFDPGEFYPPEHIALSLMPPLEIQRGYFASFQQRVRQRFLEMASTQHVAHLYQQAEQLVWQELEEIFINLPFPSEAGD